MLSLSEDKHSHFIEAFSSTSLYLDDLLNIENTFFDGMVNRCYPSELVNKGRPVRYRDFIFGSFVKTKIYDKRDDFDFDIVSFSFLYGDVPRSTSYGVYIPQRIRFVCPVMLMTVILVIRFDSKTSQSRDIIKFIWRFQNLSAAF